MNLIRAGGLTNFHEVARELGLDPERLLLEAGITPAMLLDRDLGLPAERVLGVMQRATELSGCPSFAIRMVEHRKLSNIGPMALLMRDQPTLREVLQVLMQHQRLHLGFYTLNLEEAGDLAWVQISMHGPRDWPVQHGWEIGLGVLVLAMRAVMPPGWLPLRVVFQHQAPPSLADHERILGLRPEFGQEFNAVVLRRHDLATPNPQADPDMAAYSQRAIGDGPVDPSVMLLTEVRRVALALLPSGLCSIERVAERLGVPPRTVQRRLAESGLTFSGLLNDLRGELARQHVVHGQRPLTEVAGLLGFNAPSAFSRWYQAQFGCTPTQARQRPPSAPN